MAWKELRELRENNEIIEVKIKRANKGGLISNIKGINAFIPVSHLSSEHYPKVKDGDLSEIAKALQKFIGETLKVRIIDLDAKKDKLILSEKAEDVEKERQAMKSHKQGDIVGGEITGITNFGAFVKLEDNLEGLLYPSEISEDIKTGQKVKAKIIKIADNRLYLSLKI